MSDETTATDQAEAYLESVQSCENVKKMMKNYISSITQKTDEQVKQIVEEDMDIDACP